MSLEIGTTPIKSTSQITINFYKNGKYLQHIVLDFCKISMYFIFYVPVKLSECKRENVELCMSFNSFY